MAIDRAFRPLFSFVALATSPFLLSRVVGPGGGSAGPVNTAPATMPPEGVVEDRHLLLPTVEASLLAPDEDISPYAPLSRYQVMAKDVAGNTWVTLNAPADEIPPPPNRRSGPIGCSCPNVDGIAGPRYGDTQEDGWRFGPSWLDETRPGMPFIPDLFRGAGPCFARDYTGLLQQWDENWLLEEGAKYRLSNEVQSYFEYCDKIGKNVLAALDLREAADTCAPPSFGYSRDEVKRRWDRFVGVTQERRGRIAERLVRGSRWVKFKEEHPNLWYDVHWSGLFDYIPVGVWVRDTPARARTILQYIDDGVPVYYLWKPEFGKLESLRSLFPQFAYTPKTPPGPPPRRLDSTPAASGSQGASSSHARQGNEGNTSGDFPEEQPAEFWEEADRRMDEDGFEERAVARGRIRSPPPPLLPSVARSLATPATGANSTPLASPLARAATAQPAEDRPPAPQEPVAAKRKDRTAGELYTLVPPPLKLRLNNTRPSGGRLQRIVSDAMRDEGEEDAVGLETNVRDAPAEGADLPALARRMQPARELPRLFVYDILSVKMKIHTFLMSRKSVDVLRLMQFLLSVNIQYVSGVKVPAANVDSSKWERPVKPDMWIDPASPHYVAYQRWRRNLSEILDTPRVARAVPAYGGLPARLRKYDGSILDLWREPTQEVYAHGSPRSIVLDDETFYGDWLSEEEMRVIIGASGPAGQGACSIFPPIDIFNKFYDGFWSATWEQWFSKRIDEVKKGTSGAKVMYTAHEWERRLKGSAVQ